MKGASREEGAAVVVALALMAVVMVAAFMALVVAQQASVREQLGSAADVAALAGAQAIADPCEAAGQIAVANAVTLADCRAEGTDIVITVTRPPAPLTIRLLGWLGHDARDLEVVARAGPPG